MKRILTFIAMIMALVYSHGQNPYNPEVALESVKFYPDEEYEHCGYLVSASYNITIKVTHPLTGSKALVKCYNKTQGLIREIIVNFYEKEGLPYYSYEDHLRRRERPFKRNVALVHVPLYAIDFNVDDQGLTDRIDAVEVVLFDSSDTEIGRMNAIPLQTGYAGYN